MKNKRPFVPAAVLTLAVTGMMAVLFATTLRDQLGDSLKTVYWVLLACLPVLFVLLYFALRASQSMNRENVAAVNKIKALSNAVAAAQSAPELAALQTQLAQAVLGSRPQVRKQASVAVLAVLRAQAAGTADDASLRARDEWMARWVAHEMKARLLVEGDVDVDAAKSVGAEYGRAAYAFGGYPFMQRVLAALRPGKASDMELLLARVVDEIWAGVEDWPNHRQG